MYSIFLFISVLFFCYPLINSDSIQTLSELNRLNYFLALFLNIGFVMISFEQSLTAAFLEFPTPCPPFTITGIPSASTAPAILPSGFSCPLVISPAPSIASGQPSPSESKSKKSGIPSPSVSPHAFTTTSPIEKSSESAGPARYSIVKSPDAGISKGSSITQLLYTVPTAKLVKDLVAPLLYVIVAPLPEPSVVVIFAYSTPA